MWQTIENKQKFISQIMTSKSPVRSCEDIDETALSYAEVKALATGNPYIKEKMDTEVVVARLKLLKANHQSQRYSLEDRLIKHFPREIQRIEERIAGLKADIAVFEQYKDDEFSMILDNTTFDDKKEAGTTIIELCKAQTSPEPKAIGSYKGFSLLLSYDTIGKTFQMALKGSLSHMVDLGSDIHGNIQRLDNVLEKIPNDLKSFEHKLLDTKNQMENVKIEIAKPFPQDKELKTKTARLAELDAILNMDKRQSESLDAEPEQEDEKEKHYEVTR